MLTLLLAAVCLTLILVGVAMCAALSSISLVLSEIRDTQRIEAYRTRLALSRNIGEIAYFLDPKSRRVRNEIEQQRKIEAEKLANQLTEIHQASGERKKELKEQWDREKQLWQEREQQREDEQKWCEHKAEQEYLEQTYPSRPIRSVGSYFREASETAVAIAIVAGVIIGSSLLWHKILALFK